MSKGAPSSVPIATDSALWLSTARPMVRLGESLLFAAVATAHASGLYWIAKSATVDESVTPPQIIQISLSGENHPATQGAPTQRPTQHSPRTNARSTPIRKSPPELTKTSESLSNPDMSDLAPAGIPETAFPPQETQVGAQGVHKSPAQAAGETVPTFVADYLANPAPAYPSLSRELREQGRVMLRILVSSEGRAEEVLLHHSSGFERLDEAALKAVRAWRFVPARRGSESVPAWVIVPIEFSLRSRFS